jgi:hypothetical protein
MGVNMSLNKIKIKRFGYTTSLAALILLLLISMGCPRGSVLPNLPDVSIDVTFQPIPLCFFRSTTITTPQSTNRITSFVGPTGFSPRVESSTSVAYEGKVENGNQFGECPVVIQGTYTRPNHNPGMWRATGTLTVVGPIGINFTPNILVVPRLGSNQIKVRVFPPCEYTVTFLWTDEPPGIQILPSSLTTDINSGEGTITVRDLLNQVRNITVTAMITPVYCTGADVVKADFVVQIR